MGVMKQKARLAVLCRGVAMSVGMMAVFSGHTLRAETLADALIGAYESSGLLEQNRALLRAADEDVATAIAALRPIINYTASVARNFEDRDSRLSNGLRTTTNLETTTASVGLSASLLLFDNGATALGADAAKETVLATRQQLISIEQNVLIRAVQAYLNVFAFREFVELRQNNLRLLTQELRAAQDRFEVGEVTRTDVAQAESSLADSRSGLATAQGDLIQAVEEYRSVVGRAPGQLAPPPSLPSLDGSVENARSFAVQNHPDLRSAQHLVAVAELNIMRSKATLSPTVSAVGSLNLFESLDSINDSQSGSVGIELTGPIYRGGALSSGIRSAMATRDAQRGNLLDVRRRISQNVGSAYAAFSAQQASLQASEERIRAARIAFDGVREEATLGARTTLDVLDAEQELLDAETSRISAQANLYIAAYSVLQSTGRLTARDLSLNVQLYDPNAYYDLVKDAPVPSSAQGQQLDRVLRALQKN
ncbi:Outer membrane efflux protein BepC [Roseobacter fucihabitans]|uniref:Outer membrane efflux protein BepC n=1 Tax=Roseobacter fucihabitans TaxID=1537242 RepID=A0ABZ2BTX1_9RHOB|nr:TolC family outer membrane protein [Roseobacter litoralis]MBC6967633.1 Outer membrane efflux protein BepC precursor [Roseobacter litoralis]